MALWDKLRGLFFNLGRGLVRGGKASPQAREAEGCAAAGDLIGAARIYGLLGEREKVAELHLMLANGARGLHERLHHLRVAAQFVDRELPSAQTLRVKIARDLLAEAEGAPLAGPESRRDAREAARLFGAAGEFGEQGRALKWAGDHDSAMLAFEQAGDIDALENLLPPAAPTARSAILDEYGALCDAGRRAVAFQLLTAAPRGDRVQKARAAHEARMLTPRRLRACVGDNTMLLVTAPTVRFGRQPELEVQLSDPNLSREHAVLEINGRGKWTLRDLGSRNGTFLADLRVQTAVPLPELGTFRLGEGSVFSFAITAQGIDLASAGPFDSALRVFVRESSVSVGPWLFTIDNTNHVATAAAPFLLNDKRVGTAELLRGDVIVAAGERWEIVG